MISVVICGDSPAIQQQCVAQTMLEMEGVPITVGLLETDEPIYDVQASENRSGVLIKVRAFSCNYRDKALILQTSLRCQGRPTYAFIGSEFVGEVMAVGPSPGDQGRRECAGDFRTLQHIPVRAQRLEAGSLQSLCHDDRQAL